MTIIWTATAIMEKTNKKLATPNKNDKIKICKCMSADHLKKDNKASEDFWFT